MSAPGFAAKSLLGDSAVYEEHKGDFARAREAAESALERVSPTRDPSAHAAALLDAATVAALQGDCASALRRCRESRLHAGADAALRYRATALEWWASTLRWNYYPGGSGADGAEAWQRWNALEYAGEKGNEASLLEEQLGDQAGRDASLFIFRVLAALPASRAQLQMAKPEIMEQTLASAMHSIFSLSRQEPLLERNPRMEPAILLLGADLSYRAGNFPVAVQYLGAARGRYLREGDTAGAASCRLLAGDFRVASKYSPLTLSLPVLESDSADSGILDVDMHPPEMSGPLLAIAEDEYAGAAAEFEAARAPRGVAGVLLRQSLVLCRKGMLAQGVETAARAHSGFLLCGDFFGAHLACAHRMMAQIAMNPAREDPEAAAEIGRWGETGSFSYALGIALLMSRAGWRWLAANGDAERALACFRSARTLVEQLGATLNIAQCWADEGAAYASIGDRNAAVAALESALKGYTSMQPASSPMKARVTRRVADCLQKMYSAYEHVADPDGLRYSVARAKLYRYRQFGPRTPAGPDVESFRRRLALNQLLSNPAALDERRLNEIEREVDEATMVLAQWGLDTAIDLGRVTEACYRARRAERGGDDQSRSHFLRRASSHAGNAAPQHRPFLLMTVAAHSRDFAKALAYYAEHRKRAAEGPPTVPEAVVKASGNPADAARERLRDLELQALAYARLRAYDRANQAIETLVRDFGPDWWQIERYDHAEILSLIATVREGAGHPEDAFVFAQAAAMASERARGMLTREAHRLAFSKQPTVYRLYFDLSRLAAAVSGLPASRLPQGVDPQQILDYSFDCAQLNHARTLQQAIADNPGRSDPERELNARVNAWRDLSAYFRAHGGYRRALPVVLERWRTDDDALRRLEAAENAPGADESSATATARDVFSAIPEAALLLQYSFLGEDLVVWAATRGGIVRCHRARVKEYEIDRLTSGLRRNWVRKEDAPESDALADLLLNPLADLIRGRRELILVPSGSTHLLPFHALPFDGASLGSEREVVVCPSAAVLPLLRQRPARAAGSPVVVGNPAAMRFHPRVGGDLKRGPGLTFSTGAIEATEAEAEWVGRRLAGARVLRGSRATLSAVRELLREARVIHLATHGLLVEATPQWSCILLANGENLDVQALAEIRLGAELVVLSACQTAEGEITGGNEVLGMSRALLAGGARSVVASLWQANEISTLLLMTRFYEKWLEDPRAGAALSAARTWVAGLTREDAIAALDRVQQEVESGANIAPLVREKGRLRGAAAGSRPYAHPFFWAPFIAAGM